MTVSDAINRGNNLLATSITALAGFAFLPEVFLETEREFKIDDGLLFIFGIGSIIWYLKGANRFKRSIVPIIFVCLSLIAKILGVILEFKEKDDVGDDFGGLILFVLATALVIFVYNKFKPSKE